MKKKSKLLCEMKFIIIFLILTSSCKFSPIYGPSKSSYNNLNFIKVNYPDDFNLVNLNYYLNKLLPCTQPSVYVLTTRANNKSTSFVNAKSDNFFYNTILDVSYELRKISDNRLVMKDQFIITSSYCVENSPYSTYSKQEYTMVNLARKAAEEIKTKLLIFFKKQRI